jgi:LytS/YehU family sensor histidine kinase
MILVSTAAILMFEEDRRREIVLLTYILIPLAAMVVQLFYYGTSLQYFAMMFSVVLMYVNLHLGRSTELINNETNMSRQRAAVMVSQIQPHFLYNALTAIMNIKGNPPETRDAIAEFGHYLRKNLDSISLNHPIPIERELDHVETYLYLRKLKYGDRIDVELDLEDNGFFIPPYTVKIILERAIEYNVVHGVRSLRMALRTESTDREHVLVISDLSPSEESLEFVAGYNEDIEILRARVRNMVGGTIENLVTGSGALDCVITIPVSKEGMP